MSEIDAKPCRICGRAGVSTDIDLKDAAVTAHYPTGRNERIPRVTFRLGTCRHCGLIQLMDSPDIEWLRPPRECTIFRDPERHLDDLCRTILEQLPSLEVHALGLTYKDAPLLERLEQAGVRRITLLDRTRDWNLQSPRDGIETMQQILSPQWAQTIVQCHGAADVLIVRHVLEHAHDVPTFLQGCRTLLSPGGWVLFETPGCETEFSRGDLGSLWEEHVMYFTPTTLRRGLMRHGFHCRWVGNYPYAVEDCLAAWGQFQDKSPPDLPRPPTGADLLMEFDAATHRLRTRLAAACQRTASAGRAVALWGAGHRTATFVELLGVRELIDCVIDDDPGKQGRLLPGSNLPILSADVISSRKIGLCVALLSPGTLHRIRARLPGSALRNLTMMTLDDFAADPTAQSDGES